MSDAMETIGSSLVQHGPGNDRVYLMKLHHSDAPEMVSHLERLACSRGYSKIFAKVASSGAGRFVASGYLMEASIPCFFPDGAAACFLAKYYSAKRSLERQPALVREVLAIAESQQPAALPVQLPAGFTVRVAREEDTPGMAALYGEVFATYPFPIHDPAFLAKCMLENTVYFGVWQGERLVALSSAEMEPSSHSAEMTDFATLPEYRGHGLALHLLKEMETTVQTRGIRSLFTIARAYSHGMNITFARNGYRFGGTLTNNTNIFGSLESMNVWYKALAGN